MREIKRCKYCKSDLLEVTLEKPSGTYALMKNIYCLTCKKEYKEHFTPREKEAWVT